MAVRNCTPYDTIFLDDPDYASFYLYHTIDIIVTYSIVPLISIAGILCNIAFIIVVYRVPFMRTPTTCYLVQLAVADVMFLSLAAGDKLTLTSLSSFQGDVSPVGYVIGCILLGGMIEAPYIASLFFITRVTFDRYLAICKPLRARLYTSSYRIKLSVVFWSASFLCTAALTPIGYEILCVIPPENATQEFPDDIMTCGSILVPNWLIYFRTVPFFTCLVINTSLYVAIIRAIHRRDEIRRGIANSTQLYRQARHSVDRMIVITGGLFFVLLSPLDIYFFANSIASITGYFLLSSEQQTIVIWVFRILQYINSSCNPIVYNITNSRYREAFRMVFWRKTAKSKQSNSHHSNTGENSQNVSLNTISTQL